MKLRLVAPGAAGAGESDLRVVPVAEGVCPPKRRRAAVAGFTGRAGQAAEIVTRKRRLLLVGLGPAPDPPAAERAGALAAARAGRAEWLCLDARGLSPESAAALAFGARLRAWRYDRLRTRPDPNPDAPGLCRIETVVDDPDAARPAWDAMRAVLDGVLLARDLVAEPADTLTPQTFADRLGALRRAGVQVEGLGPERLREEGLGALLAVGGGSARPPCLLVLRWPGAPGAADAPPVAFVGKGITFDTGGLCIKPAQGMWEMRADMAGAAACAGAMLTLALRRSPVPAVAVLPLAENAVGGASYRPGDVLRLFGGTTVEVVDTDAEGRLVLADALAWTVARLRPRAVVDLATLTGSIIVALGHHMAGLFGGDAPGDGAPAGDTPGADTLAGQIRAAGSAVGEEAWPMPIGERHREDLRSDIADLRQCASGRGQPDACHAAAFLREFVGDVPWAHLDIAGVESRERADDRHPAGATGWGVRLLDRLVAARFEGG